MLRLHDFGCCFNGLHINIDAITSHACVVVWYVHPYISPTLHPSPTRPRLCPAGRYINLPEVSKGPGSYALAGSTNHVIVRVYIPASGSKLFPWEPIGRQWRAPIKINYGTHWDAFDQRLAAPPYGDKSKVTIYYMSTGQAIKTIQKQGFNWNTAYGYCLTERTCFASELMLDTDMDIFEAAIRAYDLETGEQVLNLPLPPPGASALYRMGRPDTVLVHVGGTGLLRVSVGNQNIKKIGDFGENLASSNYFAQRHHNGTRLFVLREHDAIGYVSAYETHSNEDGSVGLKKLKGAKFASLPRTFVGLGIIPIGSSAAPSIHGWKTKRVRWLCMSSEMVSCTIQ